MFGIVEIDAFEMDIDRFETKDLVMKRFAVGERSLERVICNIEDVEAEITVRFGSVGEPEAVDWNEIFERVSIGRNVFIHNK